MQGRAAATVSIRAALSTALLVCCLLGAIPATEQARAAYGDARIFAPFPADPGSPEAIVVRRGKVYVRDGHRVPRQGPDDGHGVRPRDPAPCWLGAWI